MDLNGRIGKPVTRVARLAESGSGDTDMEMRERRPFHPGEILAEDVLAELGLNANQVGKALGVPANRISEILRGRRRITADTALRLGRWLGSSPTFWMNLQDAYDLKVAEAQHGQEIAERVKPLAVAP
jgi:addiction module HigA family antidote